jgi:hypothetical protein
MTALPTRHTRIVAVLLVVTGLLAVALSFLDWGLCSSTWCGGNLFAISEYTGIDLGFGVFSAVAGLGLVAIGVSGLRRRSAPRLATLAGLLALCIVAVAGGSVIWMYVLPDPPGDGEGLFYGPLGSMPLISKDFYWPPFTAILVGLVGLAAFAVSLWMRSGSMSAGRVRAVSIWDREQGPRSARAIELRHLLDALPGSDTCWWRIEVEDLNGGPTANDVADASPPAILKGAEMRRFAEDMIQSYGGTFVAFAPGASRDAVDDGLTTMAAFEVSPIEYVLLDIRGQEWIVITKSQADLESVRTTFRNAREVDASNELGLG